MSKYKYILSGFVVVAFLLTAGWEALQSTPVPTPVDLPPITLNLSASIPVSPNPTLAPTLAPRLGLYRDGVYIGPAADAFYGLIQVRTTITNGRIANVEFLNYPNDRSTSIEINSVAMPILRSEAIAAQSANVDIVTGATDTSHAFIESLRSALNQAKV